MMRTLMTIALTSLAVACGGQTESLTVADASYRPPLVEGGVGYRLEVSPELAPAEWSLEQDLPSQALDQSVEISTPMDGQSRFLRIRSLSGAAKP